MKKNDLVNLFKAGVLILGAKYTDALVGRPGRPLLVALASFFICTPITFAGDRVVFTSYANYSLVKGSFARKHRELKDLF